MNIYRIWQNKNTDYDSYDSAVVAAPDINVARSMHPSGRKFNWDAPDLYDGTWVTKVEHVGAELIGKADARFNEPTVICASFNAG